MASNKGKNVPLDQFAEVDESVRARGDFQLTANFRLGVDRYPYSDE